MSEGSIITFYSYKGGVGRTFALANIGALLSLWGYRTLCIDWDLEAPGLQFYFQPWMSNRNYPGLIELIQSYIDGKETHWQNHVTEVQFPKAKKPLLFMNAGMLNTSYRQRMQTLDWTELYAKHDLGNFLEKLREDWKKTLDFVLIDSRTGITDIGGICTVQLPDLLGLLLTANDQSLSGSLEILESIRIAQASLPFDHSKLLVMPIISRFERRLEYDLAEQWLEKFAEKLAPLYADWVHRDITIPDLLNFTRIPYIPYWSFGEKLSVIEKGTEDPDDIGFSLETLAALVAQKLSYSDVLIRNRDSFVKAAKNTAIEQIKQAEEQPLPLQKPALNSQIEIFLSYSHRDEPLRDALEKHLSSLKRQGVVRIWHDRQIPAGTNWRNEVDLHMEVANIILLLISPDYLDSEYSYVEMRQAVERHQRGEATVIPIILRPADWHASPIGKLQALPPDARPVTLWSNQDAALASIATGIRRAVQQLEKS